MNLRDIKISTRLVFGFATMATLIALVGAAALLKVRHIAEEFDSVQDEDYPRIVTAFTIKGEVNDIARAVRNFFIMTEPADIKSQLEEVLASDKAIASHFEALEKSASTVEGKAKLAEVQKARAAYRVPRDRILELVNTGKLDEAKPVLLKDMRPLQLTYMQKLDELIKLQDEMLQKSGSEVDDAAAATVVIVASLVVLSMLMGGLMAFWIIRSITGPLNRAVKATSEVAKGNLAFEIPHEGKSETGQLLDALSQMKQQLATIVKGVRLNAESVATASTQISQGNLDLSGRTEEQASALEQTAASMEQLSSTVKQNADNASQANQLARSASEIAAKGGEAVSGVVRTMRGIEDSSKRIGEIIQVIDGIAFQTNILALNAAVEAARAGEQGRGFAVVASEVRSLAHRSADAAKQIKNLIEESVNRVSEGSSLVDSAGATMAGVVESIKRVTDIMGEISSASREQSAGVEQVSDAVTQMDQVTQQNAALVEESAAAAESLMQQAGRLLSEISFFKLSAT